jgi:hypothetical protein
MLETLFRLSSGVTLHREGAGAAAGSAIHGVVLRACSVRALLACGLKRSAAAAALSGSYKQEKAAGEKGERVEHLKDGLTDDVKASGPPPS